MARGVVREGVTEGAEPAAAKEAAGWEVLGAAALEEGWGAGLVPDQGGGVGEAMAAEAVGLGRVVEASAVLVAGAAVKVELAGTVAPVEEVDQGMRP